MKLFENIRDFFWPLLEKGEAQKIQKLEPNEIKVENKHLEQTLKYALDFYESEAQRKKTVEGKSSLFISIISVITSIILGVTTVLVKTNDFSVVLLFLIFLLFVLSIYMSRTVWFSLKTLERKAYYSISINDFLIGEKNDDYFKKLISDITNKVRKNSIVINEKVDNMTMAQEYFKRAIVIVSFYSFVILIFFISKSGVNFPKLFSNGVSFLNSLNLSAWNIVILYLLIAISLILGIKANRKK
jgi:disulfide bond formation protein DsbB